MTVTDDRILDVQANMPIRNKEEQQSPPNWLPMGALEGPQIGSPDAARDLPGS